MASIIRIITGEGIIKDWIETKRKEAYDFIWRHAKKINWHPPIDSDKALAKVLCKPENQRDPNTSVEKEELLMYEDLISLKKARINPTQRLIDGVRSFFGQAVSEDNIRAYLIDPFVDD